MGKYECKICGYNPDNKQAFYLHMRRKTPCRPGNSNKRIISTADIRCKICDREFTMVSTLKNHFATFHPDQDYNCEKVIIHPYQYNNINDLTLHEQYLCISSDSSPYNALLDNLNFSKPAYNNIHLGHLRGNLIDVYNGKKWIKAPMKETLINIILSKMKIIVVLYDKFKWFFREEATKTILQSYLFGLELHKELIADVKLHLYNKNEEESDEIYWALNNFTWEEVEYLLTEMDAADLNYRASAPIMKEQVEDLRATNEDFRMKSNKLIDAIDVIISLE